MESPKDSSKPRYSVTASILGMVHMVGLPERQLEFFDDDILIYDLPRNDNRLLRKADYPDVRRCHYSGPGTLMGGGMGIMGPGVSQMTTPATIELSILKHHEAPEEKHVLDDLVRTDHFVIQEPVKIAEFEEMFRWIRDKVREKGGIV